MLSDSRIIENVRALWASVPSEYRNDTPVVGSYLPLDIKMETGTGKTYVYTKTIYELHKRYGLNKFIIAVIGFSEQIIIEDGRLALGTWQGVYFCEYDGPRRRSVYVKLMHDRLENDRVNDSELYHQLAELTKNKETWERRILIRKF